MCAGILTGGLISVVAGAWDAAEATALWKDNHGTLKSLVPEVVDDIDPGDSAVIAWLESANLEMAAPVLSSFGGRVLRTTIPPQEIATFKSLLKG